MKKVLPLVCLLVMALFAACKDKNAKPSDNQDIPGQVRQPGSINPQSVAGRLDQATSATAAAEPGLVWAGNADVVCSMKIDQTVEDTLHYQGKIYGFCSESCKESFQENPQKYAAKTAQ